MGFSGFQAVAAFFEGVLNGFYRVSGRGGEGSGEFLGGFQWVSKGGSGRGEEGVLTSVQVETDFSQTDFGQS